MSDLPRLPTSVLARVATVICGDWKNVPELSAYRRHRDLVDFFECDLRLDTSEVDGASRAMWTEGVLKKFNGRPEMSRILEAAVNPANYLSIKGGPQRAAEHLNVALRVCGLQLERSGREFRLVGHAQADAVEEPAVDLLSGGYVRSMSDKCEGRLRDGDHDGAITAARTLVESVLVELERRITGRRRDHERDLQGQFTVVRKLLNIDEERPDLDDTFKTAIKGMVLVINGLAPLRNKMSDGHARERQPAPHHARFVVNAAKTIAFFLAESYAYQLEKGLLAQPSTTSKGPA